MKNRYPIIVLSLIASIFFLLGILRLNDLSLYTDSTRYLAWGNSIAHGKGFADDTQPVPEYYVVNAPLYSVVLAPVLAVFPMSLVAAKIWTLLWGVFAILLFYLLIQRFTTATTALFATAFFTFNPLTLTLFTEVLSEAPFLCTLFAIFLLTEKALTGSASRWQTILLVVLLGLVMLLREVGAALVAVTILSLLFKKCWKLALASSLAACFLFGLWTYRNLHLVGTPETSQSANVSYIFQHFVTSPESSTLQEFFQRFRINIQWYKTELGGMLFYLFPMTFIVHPSSLFTAAASFLQILRPYIWILAVPLFTFGIVLDLRRSVTAFLRIVFVLLYLAIILVYPVNDVRFLLPLLPLCVWYCALTAQHIFIKIPFQLPLRKAAFGVAFAVILFPNAMSLLEITKTNFAYTHEPLRFSGDNTPWHSEYFSTPWHLLGAWIDQNVPPNTVIATTNKSIVSYATHQKFLELSRAVPLPQFERLLRDNAAEYIIAPVIADSIHEHQSKLNESTRFRFECVQTIGRLTLFKIIPRVHSLPSAVVSPSATFNLHNGSALYALARLAIKNEQYDEAKKILELLRLRYKRAAVLTGDLQFQQLILHTFLLDSLHAMIDLQQLYSLPTASSFIDPANAHIHAMNSLLEAQRTASHEQRASLLYFAGRFCWDFGYPHQAYRLLQQSVQQYPTYFEGNLWAWHVAMQLDQRQQAAQLLHQLDALDPTNALVKSFHHISLLRDTLQFEHSLSKRSTLLISLASEYASIDLPDEAFDAIHAALAEDSTKTAAWNQLLALFEKRQVIVAAERVRDQLQRLRAQ
jgi:4-amino-4-deoxy-L-arabinose transferase-like glycosyltransferase/tetratricopeptide (TPR) repeat protein